MITDVTAESIANYYTLQRDLWESFLWKMGGCWSTFDWWMLKAYTADWLYYSLANHEIWDVPKSVLSDTAVRLLHSWGFQEKNYL